MRMFDKGTFAKKKNTTVGDVARSCKYELEPREIDRAKMIPLAVSFFRDVELERRVDAPRGGRTQPRGRGRRAGGNPPPAPPQAQPPSPPPARAQGPRRRQGKKKGDRRGGQPGAPQGAPAPNQVLSNSQLRRARAHRSKARRAQAQADADAQAGADPGDGAAVGGP
jgi:hypothetical protein